MERLYQGEESDGAPVMRVRIARDERGIEVGGPARVLVNTDERGSTEEGFATPIVVSLSRTGWRVRGADGITRAFGGGPKGPEPGLVIRSDGSALLTLATEGAGKKSGGGGGALPGEIHLRVDAAQAGGATSRAFHVVEHVPIDQYLPGVVAKELPAGWEIEAYKAQAVAARSYALHERRRRIALGSDFDVESTTQDQAYAGATANARAHEAVRATRGLVLTWKGTLLRAYYSSTTGGRAASARDTWPTGPGFEFNLAAPIQASARDDADKASPLFRWTVERPTDELLERLRAYGRAHGSGLKGIGSLSAIRVEARNSFGRPTRYTVEDSGGMTWTLSAESIRIACNTDAPGLEPITRAKRINSGDFEARVEGDVVVFHGRGFGHGVGMSQYGAEGMAQILRAYYPGAVIERAY
jgi:stage II sporulation protein D